MTVSTSHNAFVDGRHILDKALVVIEVVDWRMKQGETGILRKLDLKKAYDYVS